MKKFEKLVKQFTINPPDRKSSESHEKYEGTILEKLKEDAFLTTTARTICKKAQNEIKFLQRVLKESKKGEKSLINEMKLETECKQKEKDEKNIGQEEDVLNIVAEKLSTELGYTVIPKTVSSWREA